MSLIIGNREDAAEAVHDAYIKLATPHLRGRFIEHPNPHGLALVTAINLRRDGWRRHARMQPIGNMEEIAGARLDGQLSQRQAELEVISLLSQLNEREALAVILVDIDGLTIRQAAELIGVSKSTIHEQHTQALEKLRKHLQ